jgi:hypothetical protein
MLLFSINVPHQSQQNLRDAWYATLTFLESTCILNPTDLPKLWGVITIFQTIFSLLSLFWGGKKVGLWDHHAVCDPSPQPLLNAWTSLYGTIYIVVPEPISMRCFINPSHQSVCMCTSLSLLGKDSVKKSYRGNENTCNNRITGSAFFYAVRVVSKEGA